MMQTDSKLSQLTPGQMRDQVAKNERKRRGQAQPTTTMGSASAGMSSAAPTMNEHQKDLSSTQPDLSQQLDKIAAQRTAAAAAFRDAGGECWLCADTGYIGFQLCTKCAAGRRAYAEAEEKQRAAFVAMLAQSDMPLEMRARDLARDFTRWGPVAEALQRYCATWSPSARGLWIYGPSGTGKSSLTAAVLTTLAPVHGGRIAWYLTADYLAQLRAAMREGGHYDQLLERGRLSQYVVLDDIGRANLGEWVSETLFMVVARRTDAQLPLFVTSNYSPDELTTRLGEHGAAIIDRLRQRCFTVKLTGGSLRQSQELPIT